MDNKSNCRSTENQVKTESKSALDQIVREGAQKMLSAALQAEVAEYIQKLGVDENGYQRVVRNGTLPEREIISGTGALKVKQPRVRDRSNKSRFSSKILPRYMRKTPSINNLIPALYLRGISTGQFDEALSAILGSNHGFSASTVTRLKSIWEEDFKKWRKQSLERKKYVYWWADGIHFNIRLEDARMCLLVIVGTLENGTKELVGVIDGYRESKLSWQDLMRNIKKRGLNEAPRLSVGDGALGFWSALREEFPESREQRCWVHKTANILDKMPKKIQPRAKEKIHEMYMSETKEYALDAYKDFIDLYQNKYPKACECLIKDKDVLFAFYDFPAEHWRHIRTTNPIESTFATVRLRTKRTKGCGSRIATLTMVFKLIKEAEKRWQRIHGYKIIPKVIKGVKFVNGIEKKVA